MLSLAAATGVFAVASLSLSVSAAPPATSTTSSVAILPRVRTLENRFFFHTYEQDPMEKRLQRLELLVFGQTKGGGDQERLQHLNTTVAERDRESALKMQRQHQATAPASPENSTSASPPSKGAPGAKYPAVTALEWRVLKKSYPNESLDDRLGRLETKLFGQPSTTMSYADRVDRLNRTLGIGAVASAPTGRMHGPTSRTRPGEQEFYFGFSDPNQKQITELFRQMNQQMEEMMRMTPGALPYFEPYPMPSSPSRKKSKPLPGGTPQWNVIPFDNSIRQTPTPYNDPNSI